MNAFYEHHKDNIRFGYRCFDRILLNGLIQPFQQPERVVGFFNTYRQQYPGMCCKYSWRDGVGPAVHARSDYTAFNPRVSLMNRSCPTTSPFGNHRTCPFRIIGRTS